MLPTKFRFNWLSSCSEEDFQKSTNQKQELPVVAMLVNELGRNDHSLQRTFHRCFLPNFNSFGTAVSEEKIFLEINQSETRIACGGHVCYRLGQNQQYLQRTFHRCFLPSFGSFGRAVSKSANQKQELLVVTMFVNGFGQNEQSLQRTFHRCFLPSFRGED